VSFTQTQIDNAFSALGLAPPPAAELTALEGVSDYYQAVQTIASVPEVQAGVAPIVQMFEATLGHAPDQTTLAAMVSSQLNEPQLATAFVSSQTFANVYNGGLLLDPNSSVTSDVVEALFIRGLGHPPTATTLSGFAGMSVAQAFFAFVTSDAISNTFASQVSAYTTEQIELAVGVLSQPDSAQIVGQSTLITHAAHIS
jgi:hypothetical protein